MTNKFGSLSYVTSTYGDKCSNYSLHLALDRLFGPTSAHIRPHKTQPDENASDPGYAIGTI
jgi:hypothetical protein